ncbi:RHS repeat-associated core domain-containing protein [Oscillatoria nigro-viridis]|uniref:RHS repeat-associated core domain-containing protein n=1 Tax=Phormidium nigroviride TaxID=482564 RepID=UPI0012372161
MRLRFENTSSDNLLSVSDTINGEAKGTTAYTYDNLNRVSRITQSGNGVASKRVDFGYDNIGQIQSVNRYSDLNGSQLVRGTTYTYDAKNRLDVLSHGSGVSHDLDYDNGNRITKITDADGFTNYTYDKNNQLTVADHSNSNKPDESFGYDANGNRNSSGYQAGTNNRLNSDGKYNYTYDDEGNLISRTEIATNKVTEYQWDYRNRLAGVVDKDAAGNAVQNVGFKYDSQNRRISKKVGNAETRFVYDRDNVLFDFTASGTSQPVLDKRYFYGSGVDQLLAQENAQGTVLWALSDQLGTVKDWVNNSGSVANHVVYDAFGGVVSQSNPAFGSRYGFTGREFDAETGLYYYRSRYYNPGIGRFIGEDAVGFDGGDANLYRYVENSPIDRIDPLGQWGIVFFQIRVILYEDNGIKFATNIEDIVKARQQNPLIFVRRDITNAFIGYFFAETGTKATKRSPDFKRGDNRGHIVGKQLGGQGDNLNNLFAQNGRSNQRWRILFENPVRKELDKKNSPGCPPVNVNYTVSLQYDRPRTLRPSSYSGQAFFTDGSLINAGPLRNP